MGVDEGRRYYQKEMCGEKAETKETGKHFAGKHPLSRHVLPDFKRRSPAF